MRTVLSRTAGRASLILATAGVVGSAALPAVPAAAGGRASGPVAVHHLASAGGAAHRSDVRIGTALKLVRNPDGSVRRVR